MKKAKVKATNLEVEVYKSRMKADYWIDSKDCRTEYHKDELIFL